MTAGTPTASWTTSTYIELRSVVSSWFRLFVLFLWFMLEIEPELDSNELHVIRIMLACYKNQPRLYLKKYCLIRLDYILDYVLKVLQF